MEGFKEKSSVSELCARFELGQSQYYKWRDQFIQNGANIFDEKPDKKIEFLQDTCECEQALCSLEIGEGNRYCNR